MEQYAGLHFREFEAADVALFTGIMKRAFDEDSRIHLGKESGGPPGYDNGDFLRQWALHPDSTAYAIYKDGVPVGAAIVNKCGFKVVKIEHPGDQLEESYILEKEMRRSTV